MYRKRVLVAVPCKDSMHKSLRATMDDNLKRLMANNDQFDLDLRVFTESFPHAEQTGYGPSIFDKPAAARNAMIDLHLESSHDYVLWIDADLTKFSPDLVTRLHGVDPDAIVAPMPFIEGTEKFYDVAAFVESGEPVYAEPPHFGNVLHALPYFRSTADVIDCDSVGCCYMAPACVHRQEIRFRSTPFTDHWPVISYAKRTGTRVVCARFIEVYHANLPKYGEQWHCEEMTKWQRWMAEVDHGYEVRPGRRPDAGGNKAVVRKSLKKSFINR